MKDGNLLSIKLSGRGTFPSPILVVLTGLIVKLTHGRLIGGKQNFVRTDRSYRYGIRKS